jgi:hypothetical protein
LTIISRDAICGGRTISGRCVSAALHRPALTIAPIYLVNSSLHPWPPLYSPQPCVRDAPPFVRLRSGATIDVQIKIRAFGVDSSLEQAGKTPKHYLNVYRCQRQNTTNWEQGRRSPHGAARVLLQVAEKHPDIVWDVALASSPRRIGASSLHAIILLPCRSFRRIP